jgi:hypothetical protein
MKRFALLAVAVFFAACGDTPIEAPIGDIQLVTAFAPAARVSMCHYDAIADTYFPIEINGNAESAHRDHGDGQVGDPVPGLEGFEFGESCQPQPVVEISACFAYVEPYWNSFHAGTYGAWDWDDLRGGAVTVDEASRFRITSGSRYAEVELRSDGNTVCALRYEFAASARLWLSDDFDASKAYLQSLLPTP